MLWIDVQYPHMFSTETFSNAVPCRPDSKDFNASTLSIRDRAFFFFFPRLLAVNRLVKEFESD